MLFLQIILPNTNRSGTRPNSLLEEPPGRTLSTKKSPSLISDTFFTNISSSLFGFLKTTKSPIFGLNKPVAKCLLEGRSAGQALSPSIFTMNRSFLIKLVGKFLVCLIALRPALNFVEHLSDLVHRGAKFFSGLNIHRLFIL